MQLSPAIKLYLYSVEVTVANGHFHRQLDSNRSTWKQAWGLLLKNASKVVLTKLSPQGVAPEEGMQVFDHGTHGSTSS
jgi:hypothetical protein